MGYQKNDSLLLDNTMNHTTPSHGSNKFKEEEVPHVECFRDYICNPTPTSMTLSVVKEWLYPPSNEKTVYLLPRLYMQHWINWAACQKVSNEDEKERLDFSLSLLARHFQFSLPTSKQSTNDMNSKNHSSGDSNIHVTSYDEEVNQTSAQSEEEYAESGYNKRVLGPRVSVSGSSNNHNQDLPKIATPSPIYSQYLLSQHKNNLRDHVLVGIGDDEIRPDCLENPLHLLHYGTHTGNRNPLTYKKDRTAPTGLHHNNEDTGFLPSLTNRHTNLARKAGDSSYDVEPPFRIGTVAVPKDCYILLKSAHGVLCQDGHSITFNHPNNDENNIYSAYSENQESTILHHFTYASPHTNHEIATQKKEDTDELLTPIEFKRKLNPKTNDCEVYPIQFDYEVVFNNHHENGKLRIKSKNGIKGKRGFVLASRLSSLKQVMIEMTALAAPQKSHECIRLWYSLHHVKRQDRKTFATQNGDGFELLELNDASVTNKQSETIKAKDPTVVKELTCGEWVHQMHFQPHLETASKDRHNYDQNFDESICIKLLVEVRDTPTSLWPRKEYELSQRIQVGDYVDAQDSSGLWYESIVRSVSEKTVKVHYLGWSSRWDCTIKRYNDIDPPASSNYCKVAAAPQPLWTHSTTNFWRERLQIEDTVEIREAVSIVQRPRWYKGIIKAFSDDSKVLHEIVGGAELELFGKNKKPLLLLENTRQVLIHVPQEWTNVTSNPTSRLNDSLNNNTRKKWVAQPPHVRWVNLYGEEICKLYTHLKPELSKSSIDDNDSASSSSSTIEPVTDKPPITQYNKKNIPNNNKKVPQSIIKTENGTVFARESLKGIPPAPGSVGLHNLGNSCFLNSILQCLNHIPQLTTYFLNGHFQKDLNKENALGSGGLVAKAYASLLEDMWSGEYSKLAPRALKNTVAAFAPQFNNFYQHDSQEFCSFLMDGLHEDLNRVIDKPYVKDVEGMGMDDNKAAVESWKNHLLRHDSIIVDHCQGMHRSHITCPICGNQSIKFDVYSSISLPLHHQHDKGGNASNDGIIPLAKCLESFTAGERLDEENAWYCPKCKDHVCALKKMTLWTTPDILILHLKRFTFDTCKRKGGIVRSKIDNKVDFPVDRLDMQPYIMGAIDEQCPPVYQLFGVSEHSGRTANSGHYTATVRNSRDGKWYRYNDSHVGSTTGDAAISGGAYLLFYKRLSGSIKWAGMEKLMNPQLNVISSLKSNGNHQKEGQNSPTDPRNKKTDEDGFTQVKTKKKKKTRGAQSFSIKFPHR